MKKITKVNLVILSLVLSLAFFLNASVSNNIRQSLLPPVVISATVPTDVSPSVDTVHGNPIAFFDDYSWRVFLAMVWPAQTNKRGIADTTASLDKPNTPRVFETFKSDWEIFQPNGAAPTSWNDFGSIVPCKTGAIGFNDMVLASFSKFGNLGQAGFGNLVGPLVAQNNTYVRFLTGFNQIEFQQIATQQLYLRQNLTSVTLQNGAIDVKSAWIDMTNVAHPDRYYTRIAWLLDPSTGDCLQKLVGLVGLHIVQKTPSRPQWIWTSFEQVDNISQNGAASPFAFNDGSGTPMPNSNPIVFPPPPIPPSPFNVNRITPINPSTVATNSQYQQALKSRGSVWQFYQLATTQWPVPGNTPANGGDPGHTFPGVGATSAFANVTMETFDQKRIQTGCMNCHNLTKTQSDFLWSLQVNAFPTSAPSLAMQFVSAKIKSNKPQFVNAKAASKNKALQKLKALLTESAKK